MKTTLKGRSTEVTIDHDGPMTIIGESINPTRRAKLSEAFETRQYDYVLELAQAQIEAGADVLDINVGAPGIDEVTIMREVVQAVAGQFDIPLCLDSPDPNVLAAGLSAAPGRALVNSVNGEERSLNAILPVVREFGVPVIGLTMDDDGIAMDAGKRLAIAGKILERAAKLGIPEQDVVIDPLVMAVSADHTAGKVALETITRVYEALGVNINLGASNVSFGLPDRHTLNQAFLALAIHAGASCAITNPVKLTSTIRAADLLMGRDEYSMRYIAHYRSQNKT